MARKPVGSRQFLDGLIAVFEIDGSEVTTSYANTALDKGKHIAKIKVGASSDANLFTIKLNLPLGMVPSVLIQPVTLNVACRVETATKQLIPIRSVQASDLSTPVTAPDMTVFLFGSEQIREGSY